MTPRDWTLLVIASAMDRPLEPVQLQKALFLIGQMLSEEERQTASFYTFEPRDYGPFCTAVYTDAEDLQAEGLVSISRPPEVRFKEYAATEDGLRAANELKRALSRAAVKFLADVVAFTQALSFNELVSAIYRAYPDMKANSVFRD
jgi:hypothetical protein